MKSKYTYEVKEETPEMKQYRASAKMAKEIRTSHMGIRMYSQDEIKKMTKEEKKAFLKTRGITIEGPIDYTLGRGLGYKYK